jgi:hypothetical protein
MASQILPEISAGMIKRNGKMILRVDWRPQKEVREMAPKVNNKPRGKKHYSPLVCGPG